MADIENRCETCNTSFEAEVQLNIHNFRTHGKLIPCYRCKLCNKLYPSKITLKNHKTNIHEQSNLQEQPAEPISNQSQKITRTEESIQKYYECEICGEDFTKQNKLKRHISKSHNHQYHKDLGHQRLTQN